MFRDHKATAMAAYFLTRADHNTLNDIVLMKLMVVAECESIRHMTALIAGDTFYSMRNGPVLSNVLNLMNGTKPSDFWGEHISFQSYGGTGTEDNRCILIKPVKVDDYLSEIEIDILSAVWRKFGNVDKWKFVNWAHELPFWDGSVGKSSKPIPLDVIFASLVDNMEEARRRSADLEYYEKVTS